MLMDGTQVRLQCAFFFFFLGFHPPSLSSPRHHSSPEGYIHPIDWNFLSPLLLKKIIFPQQGHWVGVNITRLVCDETLKENWRVRGKLYWVFQRETALKFISVKMRRGGMACRRGEGRSGPRANINAALKQVYLQDDAFQIVMSKQDESWHFDIHVVSHQRTAALQHFKHNAHSKKNKKNPTKCMLQIYPREVCWRAALTSQVDPWL